MGSFQYTRDITVVDGSEYETVVDSSKYETFVDGSEYETVVLF